ncbi:MFS transporter [Neobacillus sp. PS2-9]|uniref:MFS transporter n=1 Tax=Neobacillus sp. PS2-9 TaxID=3070676 RepID=UPI0027E0CA6B|nr:MFS transporter [Neobacillus sp. PS2-9]WML57813.1 MFS transporter [Neobacillus sp. PS2-9]
MTTLQVSVNEGKNRTEIKNLFLFSTGKTVSIFGTAIYQFALGLYVLKLTGSAISFAATLILGIIPMIVINPFAGVIADKFNKKRLIVSMDLLNGVLLVAVYVLSNIIGFKLWIIYVTTILMTVFSTFFGVALESAKPNIVSKTMLMNINSISKIIDSISSIMGPMLGGIVFAIFDIRTFIMINGISFIFSGISMMLINFKQFQQQSNEELPKEKIHFLRDIKDGFHYITARKKILNLFILLISLNFFLGFTVTVPIPYIMNTVLGLGSKNFGIIQGSFPVGMIMGALMVKKLTKKIPYSSFLRYLSVSLSTLMIITGLPVLLEKYQFAPVFYVIFYSIVMFLIGAIVALIDIPLSYIMQNEIPEEFRGRVLSIGISIGKAMLPLALVTSGILLTLIPSYMIQMIGGGLFLLFILQSTTKMKVELKTVSIDT